MNKEVLALLDSNVDLRAIVLDTGEVFYVPTKTAFRLETLFFKCVERVCGSIAKQRITPLQHGQVSERLLGESSDLANSIQAQKETPINASLEWVFSEAIIAKATDVYLIMTQAASRLEYKVYGQKYTVAHFNLDQGRRLASLIWTESDGQFELAEPCDCSFSFEHQSNVYRIRANSVCTSEGGNVVACRIRDPKDTRAIETLGYADEQLAVLHDICGAPGGLILFTGATNSGKSTSVTSLMSQVKDSSHMIEVADPVEVELPNCVHIELDRYHKNHEAIFRQVLSSIVRQNPDILSLGEIRDERTASAAVNLGLQGKRVYSTLHSTTASAVFSRMSGLGVPDHVLALPDFIAGIISQNLVPIPCKTCGLSAEELGDSDEEISLVGLDDLTFLDLDTLRFIREEGCDQCIRGVEGQTLVAEIHPYANDTGEVYKLITERKYYELENYMRVKHNVLSKAEHARDKMNAGEIDPLATLRIVGAAIFQKLSSEKHMAQSPAYATGKRPLLARPVHEPGRAVVAAIGD